MATDDEVMNRYEAGLRRFARELDCLEALDLLREALTHSSFANESATPIEHNERLEFLGDAVLGMVVSQVLFESHPKVEEGALSRLRASIVNENSLAEQAGALGLGNLVRLGKGEERTHGRTKASVLSNAFEAVVGALYQSMGIPAAAALVERCFGDRMRNDSTEVHRDWKTRLQEAAQRILQAAPDYIELDKRGPDHAREFDMAVTIAGREYGRGTGTSKRRAQRAAAEQALKLLEAETAAAAAAAAVGGAST